MTGPGPADGKAFPEPAQPIGHIRLYIAGATPNSMRAQQNLRAAIDIIARMATLPDVEIIDVFKGPKRAITDGIFVTPTLVAEFSDKRAMMVGDLSDAAALASILDAAFPEAG